MPLSVGDDAPTFALPAVGGGQVTLEQLCAEARNGVIVYFYPKAASPGCTTEACDFRDNLASLQSAGYAVVGISPDPLDAVEAFARDEGLTFPLASDADLTVSPAWGVYGPVTRDGVTFDAVRRSTFIVDPAGRIVLAQYGVDAKGHVASLRAELAVG